MRLYPFHTWVPKAPRGVITMGSTAVTANLVVQGTSREASMVTQSVKYYILH